MPDAQSIEPFAILVGIILVPALVTFTYFTIKRARYTNFHRARTQRNPLGRH